MFTAMSGTKTVLNKRRFSADRFWLSLRDSATACATAIAAMSSGVRLVESAKATYPVKRSSSWASLRLETVMTRLDLV